MINVRWNSRTVQIVLFVSLALNLFFAGFYVANWWGHAWHEPPRGVEEMVERIGARLPATDRAVLRSAWAADQAKLTGLFTEVQNARRDMRAKLALEPFDRAAVAAAMNEVRVKRQAFFDEVQGVLLTALPNISPDGRKRLWSGGRQR